MPAALPHCYHSLAPFREAFAGGLPILTYHKLGPRPRHVRLKGLYLGTKLFDRQLAEFRAAGYRTVWPDHHLTGGGSTLAGRPVMRAVRQGHRIPRW